MKECSQCGECRPLSEYYSRSNKCKPCYRANVKKNRESNKEYYRQYDRERGNRQEPGYLKDYRDRFPNKYKAHNLVNNSIRDGKLHAEPCEICGSNERVHAHHDDYLKPLNVRWLCAVHHHQWHAAHGEASNP